MGHYLNIKHLKLNNFKCFDDKGYEFTFGNKLTVFIGENGTGKTSLLQALKKALSFFLTKDKRKNIAFIGDGQNIRQNTLKFTDATYPFDFSLLGTEPDYHIGIDVIGEIYGEEKQWQLIKDGKGKDSQMPYRDALDTFLNKVNVDSAPMLPLLAYFSDSFPHSRNGMSQYEKSNLDNNMENIERRAGYYRWDEDNTDFYFWEGLFVKAVKQLNDFSTGLSAIENKLAMPQLNTNAINHFERRRKYLVALKAEVEYVKHYLMLFSEILPTHDNDRMALYDVFVGTRTQGKNRNDVLRLDFQDGTYRYFDMLPEGYKRLFSMVFEISYRYFLLNRKQILASFDEDIDYEKMSPDGVVIIDEIELHLHPTLVQEVVLRFQKVFPKLQLIVSTHSPAVVGNVVNDGEDTRVIKLNPDHSSELLEDCFGASYGDTLTYHMGSYGKMHMLAMCQQLYQESKEHGDEDGIALAVDYLRTLFQGETKERYVEEVLTAWSSK